MFTGADRDCWFNTPAKGILLMLQTEDFGTEVVKLHSGKHVPIILDGVLGNARLNARRHITVPLVEHRHNVGDTAAEEKASQKIYCCLLRHKRGNPYLADELDIDLPTSG